MVSLLLHGIELQELTEGKNDWCNIPSVICSTFVRLNQAIVDQNQHIQNLELLIRNYQTKMEKEHISSIQHSEKLTEEMKTKLSTTNNEVERMMKDLEFRVETKADRNLGDMVKELERFATLVDRRMHDKANVSDLEELFNGVIHVQDFADVSRVSPGSSTRDVVLNAFNHRIDRDELKRVVAEFSHTLQTTMDVISEEVALKCNTNDVMSLVNQKADIQQVNEALKSKASKASVATALQKKANRDEVESAFENLMDDMKELLKRMSDYEKNRADTLTTHPQPQIEELEKALTKTAAGLNSVILDLDLKANRTEVTAILEDKLQNIEHVVYDTQQKMQTIENDFNTISKNMDKLSQKTVLKDEVQALVLELQKKVNQKADVEDIRLALSSKIDRNELSKALETKPNIDDIDRRIFKLENQGVNSSTHDSILEQSSKTFVTRDEYQKSLMKKVDKEELVEFTTILGELDKQVEFQSREQDTLTKVMSDLSTKLKKDVETNIKQFRTEISDIHSQLSKRLEAEVFHSLLEEQWQATQDSLALKANLGELQQLRKDSTEVTARMVVITKEVHEIQNSITSKMKELSEELKLEVLKQDLDFEQNDSESILGSSGLKESLTSPRDNRVTYKIRKGRISVDDVWNEIERINQRLKKKADRDEVLDLLRLKPDTSELFSNLKLRYVGKEELLDILKQKVDYGEFVQNLSTKISRKDIQTLLVNPPTASNTHTDTSNNNSVKDQNSNKIIHDIQEFRSWTEQNLHRIDRELAGKSPVEDVIQVRETLHKKLDVSTFLEAQTDINNSIRKVEKDVREISYSIRVNNGISSSLPQTLTTTHFMNSKPFVSTLDAMSKYSLNSNNKTVDVTQSSTPAFKLINLGERKTEKTTTSPVSKPIPSIFSSPINNNNNNSNSNNNNNNSDNNNNVAVSDSKSILKDFKSSSFVRSAVK